MPKSHDPASRANESHKRDSYLSRRKRFRKQAEREYPGRSVAWFGGRLYFTDNLAEQVRYYHGPEEVPGIECVPKPGHEAVGYTVAQIAPPRTQPEYHSSHRRRW